MESTRFFSGCVACGLSRRGFLAGCAECAMAAGSGVLRAAEGGGKVKIRVIYSLHAEKQPGPDWPNVGFDFEPVMERINAELAKALPGL